MRSRSASFLDAEELVRSELGDLYIQRRLAQAKDHSWASRMKLQEALQNSGRSRSLMMAGLSTAGQGVPQTRAAPFNRRWQDHDCRSEAMARELPEWMNADRINRHALKPDRAFGISQRAGSQHRVLPSGSMLW
jgi:hypothetical protein